ncbi:MAG: hypothetical protein AB7O57_05415 [Hyphomicrobiaceae bacterium]
MTRTLLVAYDLARSSDARPLLADALMTMADAWARPLETAWMLRTSLGAAEVEARLSPLLGADDGLMVQETRGEACLANTGLRWFRPRRRTAAAALSAAAELAFAAARNDDGDEHLDRAA